MNEVSRRSLLKVGLFSGAMLVTAPILAACSSPAGGGASASGGRAAINLWTHDKAYSSYFTSQAKAFNSKKSTPYTFSIDTTTYAAADLVTKLLAAASANQPTPDMVGLEIGQFPRLMKNNIAASLLASWDDRIAKVKDDLIASRLAPYTVDGKVYGLDSSNPICVYYYRTDLVEQYKVPNPETWEEFAEFGATFHQQTGKSLVPISTGPDNGSVSAGFLQFLLQRGGAFFDKNGKLAIDSDETVDTIEFIAAGLKSGFMLGLDNFYGGPIQAGFKSDTLLGAAMPDWYNTYGIQATVPEQKGKWAIRPMPKFAKGGFPTSTAGGTGFTGLKGHKNTTAVMDLIGDSYLTTDGQVKRFQQTGYLPTLKSAYENKTLLDYTDAYLGGQKTFTVYAKLADHVPPFYQSANMPIISDVFGGPLLDAYKGKIDAKTAISQAVSAYKQQVSG